MSSRRRLQELYINYGSYHHNVVNKIIHFICIPLIAVTLGGLIEHLNIRFFNHPDCTATLLFITVVLLYYLYIDIGAGIASTVVYLSMWWFQNKAYQSLDKSVHWNYALVIHILAWVFQFIGHGVFEKRKPALLDNLSQYFSANLFVVVELLFFLGWEKQLQKRCELQITKNVTEFREQAKLKK